MISPKITLQEHYYAEPEPRCVISAFMGCLKLDGGENYNLIKIQDLSERNNFLL